MSDDSVTLVDAYTRARSIATAFADDVADPSAEFWQAAREGRIAFRQCASCDSMVRSHVLVCDVCGEESLSAVSAGVRGSVYSFTAVYQAFQPRLRGLVPYYLGLVDLDNGVRVLAQVLPASGSPAIGDRAVPYFMLVGELRVPIFVVGDGCEEAAQVLEALEGENQ